MLKEVGRLVILCGFLVACDKPAPPPEITPASEPASVAASEPVEAPPMATVVAQKGVVEVQRKAGEWKPIKVGDRLDVTDNIRTSDDGEVDIAVRATPASSEVVGGSRGAQPAEVQLRIHERSQFAVKKLNDSVIRGRLTGRMESQVKAGKGQVEIEADGSDAVVHTSGGHFSMISNGKGVVAVANLAGDVDVAAKGKTVNLKAGQVSHIKTDTAPETGSKALRNILLAVQWPEAKLTNRKTITLQGKVEVGSRVIIQGRAVEPEDNGTFTAQVELRPGKQEVAVVATDVLGRKKRMQAAITHDAKAPTVKLKDKLWQ